MRRSRLSFVVLSLGTSLAGAVFAASPPSESPPEKDAMARGEYLSKVAHCAACHTSDPAKPFAGNVPLGSSFGTMYSSNITPDTQTGIGTWTEKEFEGSLRRGVGKGGEYLYPSMPYTDFTKISDADVHALYVYFRSVKPIAQRAKPNTMKFPFNVRTGIAAWQAVYFKQGRYAEDDSQSPAWNRGAYLVQGLGHCGACHSPTNFAMAPVKGKALQGNVIDHWFAPDISGGRYSGIKDWSETDLVTFFRKGHNAKNQAAVGPMAQTIDLGLSHLSDGDLAAIATYLKHQVGTVESAPKVTRAVTADERAAGQTIYADNCTSCHGVDGKGVAGIAPALADAASVAGAKADTAVRSVLQGYEPSGQWGVMPSFGQVLTAQQVSDVVNYVRTAWGNQGGERVTASSVDHLARYADLNNPKIDSALICPSPKAASMDASTIAQIKTLAGDKKTQAATAKLVRDYRSRHPDVATPQVITNISGAFCRDVMDTAKGSLAERQTRYVNFMGGVAQAASASK